MLKKLLISIFLISIITLPVLTLAITVDNQQQKIIKQKIEDYIRSLSDSLEFLDESIELAKNNKVFPAVNTLEKIKTETIVARDRLTVLIGKKNMPSATETQSTLINLKDHLTLVLDEQLPELEKQLKLYRLLGVVSSDVQEAVKQASENITAVKTEIQNTIEEVEDLLLSLQPEISNKSKAYIYVIVDSRMGSEKDYQDFLKKMREDYKKEKDGEVIVKLYQEKTTKDQPTTLTIRYDGKNYPLRVTNKNNALVIDESGLVKYAQIPPPLTKNSAKSTSRVTRPKTSNGVEMISESPVNSDAWRVYYEIRNRLQKNGKDGLFDIKQSKSLDQGGEGISLGISGASGNLGIGSHVDNLTDLKIYFLGKMMLVFADNPSALFGLDFKSGLSNSGGPAMVFIDPQDKERMQKSVRTMPAREIAVILPTDPPIKILFAPDKNHYYFWNEGKRSFEETTPSRIKRWWKDK